MDFKKIYSDKQMEYLEGVIMRCKICGFIYIKPSDTCCPQCGVSVEDLKNVKEDFYKKNKIKRKRSFRVPGIITAAFIPILGFISYL